MKPSSLNPVKKMETPVSSQNDIGFHEVAKYAPDAIITSNTEGEIVFWNRGAERIFGYELDEIFGQPVTKIIPERYRDAHANGFDRFINNPEQSITDTTHNLHALRKGEVEFPIELTLTSWHLNGKLYISSFIRDASERIKTENRLSSKNSELNFQKLSLDAHAIVSIADVKGNITYANDKFCKISGYSIEELIGKNHSILKSGEHGPEFYKEMWDTIANRAIWHGIIKNSKKNGDAYWVEATIVPFLNEKGKPFQYVAIRTDITDRVLAQRSAERANKTKSEFLSSMSHELRTPLNAILGFSQLLGMNREDNLSEKQQSNIKQIQDAGNHLLQLIDEVLDLAKVESGNLSLNIEAIDLSDLLNQCIDFTSIPAQKNNIEVSIIHNFENVLLKVDRLRLKQAILNLLSNAIKYNFKDGNVWIDGHFVNEETYRISIVDTGFGIPIDKQCDVFTSFSRLGAETSSIEGTGIGLSLTKAIVEEMNGSIGFNSLEGKTSTFWLELPVAQGETAVQGQVPITNDYSVECCEDQHTLLYIEDNKTNIELMNGLVDIIPNLKIVTAVNGTHGVSLALSLKPHLILLDMNLPDISGLEVLERLAIDATLKDIPVIALSADAMPENIQEAKKLGIKGYITKPFKIPEIITMLNKYIGN